MQTREEFLKVFIEEVQKDGLISSWYLAEKYQLPRSKVASDLMYAKSKNLIVYKKVNSRLYLIIDFSITDDGLKFIKIITEREEKPLSKLKGQEMKEYFSQRVSPDDKLKYYLKEIQNCGFKGTTISQLSEKFGLSKSTTKKYIRNLRLNGLVRFDKEKQVYFYIGCIDILRCVQILQIACKNILRRLPAI